MPRRRLASLAVLILGAVACNGVHDAPRAGVVAGRAGYAPGANLDALVQVNGATTLVGRVAGSATVSPTGAAKYAIPIQVPPGTRGTAPDLSLVYDSQAPNGMVGVGFQLVGMAAITRCAYEPDVDNGMRGGVHVSASDRFCLDGSELVATSGTYGADGTTYRLHRDDWTKIVSKGTCGVSPCTFEATRRDGTTIEFGSGTSGVPAWGRTDGTLLAWSVASQSDVDGNEIQYTYTFDVANAQQLPWQILYSSNPVTGALARRSVTFGYEARNDTQRQFIGGSEKGLVERLTHIDTAVDGATVLQYTLSYGESPATARSRLESLTVCDASGGCMPSTTFAWNDGNSTFVKPTPALDTPGPSMITDPFSYAVKPAGNYADFNGDGYLDYSPATCSTTDACSPHDPCTQDSPRRVFLGGPTKFSDSGYCLPGAVNIVSDVASDYHSRIGGSIVDVNGDGRADYVRGTCNGPDTTSGPDCDLSVYLSTGAGFDLSAPRQLPLPLFQVEPLGFHAKEVGTLVDVNGDGIVDYVAGVCADRLTTSCNLSVWLGSATGDFSPTNIQIPGPLVQSETGGWQVQPAGVLRDLDGDRIADYVAGSCNDGPSNDCNLQVYRGTGAGFESAGFDLPGPLLELESLGWHSKQQGVLQDLNGDGIVDYVSGACPDTGAACDLEVHLGTGQRFVDAGFALPPGGLFRTESLGWNEKQQGDLEDFNGDGYADYVSGICADASTGDCQLGIFFGSDRGFTASSMSLPAGLFQSESLGWSIKREGMVVDLNGDGQPDYSPATCNVGASCDLGVSLNQLAGADELNAIVDGFQLKTSFTYAPLTQLYTPGAAPAGGVETRWPLSVVNTEVMDDGRGQTRSYSYAYEGSWVDRTHDAWMGFQEVTRNDRVSGHTLVTTYYPGELGLPHVSTEYDGSHAEVRSSDWEYIRESEPSAPAVVRHLLTQETQTELAAGGAVTATAQYSYDANDDVTEIVETGSGAAPRKTCRAYQYLPGVWRFGDVIEEKVGSGGAVCGQPWTPGVDLSWTKRTYTPVGHVATQSAWSDTAATWYETQYSYDAYGNQVSVVDALGATSKVVFDPYNTFPSQQYVPASGGGPVLDETLVYDPRFGALLTRTLHSGVTFQASYDTFGRLVAEYGPGPDGTGQVDLTHTSFGMDATLGPYAVQQERIAWTGATGNQWLTTKTYSDVWGGQPLQQKVSQSATIQTEMQRDARGRPIRTSTPHFSSDAPPWTTVTYDEADRITSRTDPDGVQHLNAYSVATGLVTTTTDPSGTSSVETSARGAEITRTLQNGGVVRTTSDALDRPVQVTDPTGLAHTQTFDSRGHGISDTTADSGTTTFTYDAVGNQVSRTDADGRTVSLTYDARGRVIEQQIDGPLGVKRVTYAYDAGQLGWGLVTGVTITQASGSTASETIGYDAYGHVATRDLTIDGREFVSSFSVGPTGIVEQTKHPNGSVVDEYLDDRGLTDHVDVSDATGATTTYATFRNYDALDNARTAIYSNGASSQFAYDDGPQGVGAPLGVTTVAGGTTVLQQSYAWSQARNLTSITDAVTPAQSRTFAYDGMGFLTQSTDSAEAQSYSYDPAGAILTKEGVSYSYVAGTHRIASTSDGAVFTYTKNGNRTQMTRPGVPATSYSYEADGSLSEVQQGGATVQQFAYDALGQRYSKIDPDGTKTLYLSASDELTISPDGSELYTLYVYGPTGRVAAITAASPSGANLLGGAGLLAQGIDRLRGPFGDGSVRGVTRTFLLASLVGVGGLAGWGALAWVTGALGLAGARRRTLHAALVAPLAGILVLATSPAYGALSAIAGPGRPEAGVVFFHEDPIASTVVVTGAQGDVVARMAYTPFGEIDEGASSGQDVFRPKFAGKEWEKSAGAYYFGARYYDPKVGAFLSPDGARQFFSGYTYAGNSPRSAVDPSGNFAFLLVLAVAAFTVAGAGIGAGVYAATTPPEERTSGGWARAVGIGAAVGFVAGLTVAVGGAGAAAAEGTAAVCMVPAAGAGPAAAVAGGAVGSATEGIAAALAVTAGVGLAGGIFSGGMSAGGPGDTPPTDDGAESAMFRGMTGMTRYGASQPRSTQGNFTTRSSFASTFFHSSSLSSAATTPTGPLGLLSGPTRNRVDLFQDMTYQWNTPASTDGYFDVFVHGSRFGFSRTRDGASISPTEIADQVRAHPDYHGQPIRLYACDPGVSGYWWLAPPAHRLANALGVNVLYPDSALYFWHDGTFRIGPGAAPGKWEIFKPEPKPEPKSN